jgi:NDP-sugar pyrophosphorylase family protein
MSDAHGPGNQSPSSVAAILPQQAVLLAGGRGTRLGALARTTPKPLLPVQGVPVIERMIVRLHEAGVERCIVVTCHLADVLETHLGDGRDLGVRIDYLREPFPLGTAGCLGLLAKPDRSFFLVNADLVTDLCFVTLAERHGHSKAAATVAVRRHETPIEYGLVEFDAEGHLTSYREKPVHEGFIGMGIYCLAPRVCDLVGVHEAITMPEVLDRLMDAGETVLCHRHDGIWCDIGRPADYELSQQLDLSRGLHARNNKAA